MNGQSNNAKQFRCNSFFIRLGDKAVFLAFTLGLRLPAGAQGAAAIYTDVGSGFSPLRRVVVRTYTWSNWLYPLPI